MKPSTGQSSVEFAVALSSLALLATGMLAVGAWQEAQRRVLLVARQAAFERLWSGSDGGAERVTRLHQLHLGDPGLATPLTGGALTDSGSLSNAAVTQRLEGAPGTAERALLQVLDAGSAFPATQFDPGGSGWTGARIELQPRPMGFLPVPLNTLELRLRGSMLLLDDGWAAAGPDQVAQRSGALAPTHALAALQAVVRPLLLPLSLLEPSLARFCPGLLDPDGVPEDRLSPTTSTQPMWNSCR
jgi:hypothetical protein